MIYCYDDSQRPESHIPACRFMVTVWVCMYVLWISRLLGWVENLVASVDDFTGTGIGIGTGTGWSGL